MSLDVYLTLKGVEVFEANITHNLVEMAQQVGIITPSGVRKKAT